MDSNTRCEPRCDGKILKRLWEIVSISLIRSDTGSRIGIVAGIFFGKVMAKQEILMYCLAVTCATRIEHPRVVEFVSAVCHCDN